MHLKNFLNRFLSITNDQVAIFSTALYILLWLIRRPSSLTSYSCHLCSIQWVVFISSLLTIFSEEGMHMNAYLKILWVMTKMFIHFFIVFKQGLELCRITTNDSKDHRHTEPASSQ